MIYYRQLISLLEKIDGNGYKAYKKIKDKYNHDDGFILVIDHVQSDPFATPSKVTLQIPLRLLNVPKEYYNNPRRKMAFEDYALRKLDVLLKRFSSNLGSGSSGKLFTDTPGQEIIFRTNSMICNNAICLRFYVGLPAFGRRINGKGAIYLFNKVIPQIVKDLVFTDDDIEKLWKHIYVVENAYAIRTFLEKNGYIAFIADGSILPRESGVSDKPLRNAVKFISPSSLRVLIEVPYGEPIAGMAISKGITLITGGGFHGKSTLLNAIAKGIFYHIPGDGREYVVTITDAIRVRAEDGRSIANVDISMFINDLPMNKDTKHFSTGNASGSTSQAASIIEAIQAGAKLLLMDEDTCATNFMVRDYRMQKLIPKDYEPITPLIDRLKEIYEKFDVSTVMVVGGLGDYLDIADTVVVMKYYEPFDSTKQAKDIVKQYPSNRNREEVKPIKDPLERWWVSQSLSPKRNKFKFKVPALDKLIYDKEEITFYGYDMFNTFSQLKLVAYLMYAIGKSNFGNKVSPLDLQALLNEVWENGEWKQLLSTMGIKEIYSFAAVRHLDLAVVVNRYRRLRADV